MNNPILTEQEANTPVTFRDVQIILEEFTKLLCESKISDINALNDAFKDVIGRIEKLQYQQIKDMRFLLSMFDNLPYVHKSDIYKDYKNWCETCDKLNKKER